jgi:ABC-type transport system involved in cytochrome c biogenesis permease subunit
LSTWLRNNALVASAALAVVLLAAAIAMIAFYAPLDVDGLNQKIFYFHVPIALTSYGRVSSTSGKESRGRIWRATSRSTRV